MKKSMILLFTTAFATVMVLKTSGVFAVGESPVEQTMINYQIEDVEDTDIINQEITKKVQEAISSQPRIFKNIISQDTYENYNLDWQYSVRGYNDLLTVIDGNNINASFNSFKSENNQIYNVSFKDVNGAINAKLNATSFAPVKYVYCPAKSYASSYIVSFDSLKELWKTYGQEYRYNVFFTFK